MGQIRRGTVNIDCIGNLKEIADCGRTAIRYRCFDGSKSVSVSRLGKGMYRVYLPSSWSLSSRYIVMATGIYSTAENTPIYPTVKAIYSYYFDIYTQDDASRNDGSFNFQVISTADWDL